MSMPPKLRGQVRNVQKAIRYKTGEGVYQGVVAIALNILGKAQKNAPRETGNLMGSGFVVAYEGADNAMKIPKPPRDESPKGAEESAAISEALQETKGYVATHRDPLAVVAFGASYAEIVHEDDPDKNWHDGGPKYLEKAVDEETPNMDMVMRREMWRAWQKS